MQKVKKIVGSTTSVLLGLFFLVIFFVFYGVALNVVDDVGSYVIGIFTNRSLPSNANTAGHWTNQFKQGTLQECIQEGHTQANCTCYTSYVSQKYSTDYALKFAKTNGWSQVDRNTIEECFD